MINATVTKLNDKNTKLTVPDGRLYILLTTGGTVYVESPAIFVIDKNSCLFVSQKTNFSLNFDPDLSAYIVDIPMTLLKWHIDLQKKNSSPPTLTDISIQKRYIEAADLNQLEYLLADTQTENAENNARPLTLAFYLLSLKRTRLQMDVQLPVWLENCIVNIDISETASDITEKTVKISNYSRSNFLVLFKKLVGISFSQYVTEMKIKAAIELLQIPSLSILDISGILNFSSLSYFIINFKNYTGTSPGLYRKTHNLVKS